MGTRFEVGPGRQISQARQPWADAGKPCYDLRSHPATLRDHDALSQVKFDRDPVL